MASSKRAKRKKASGKPVEALAKVVAADAPIADAEQMPPSLTRTSKSRLAFLATPVRRVARIETPRTHRASTAICSTGEAYERAATRGRETILLDRPPREEHSRSVHYHGECYMESTDVTGAADTCAVYRAKERYAGCDVRALVEIFRFAASAMADKQDRAESDLRVDGDR